MIEYTYLVVELFVDTFIARNRGADIAEDEGKVNKYRPDSNVVRMFPQPDIQGLSGLYDVPIRQMRPTEAQDESVQPLARKGGLVSNNCRVRIRHAKLRITL